MCSTAKPPPSSRPAARACQLRPRARSWLPGAPGTSRSPGGAAARPAAPGNAPALGLARGPRRERWGSEPSPATPRGSVLRTWARPALASPGGPGSHGAALRARARGAVLTWRWSREDTPAVASISTPSAARVRNMSPRYQGTEMVTSTPLQDTRLSPPKSWGYGMAADTDGPRGQTGSAGSRGGGPGFSCLCEGPTQTPLCPAAAPDPAPGALREPPGRRPPSWGVRPGPPGARARQGSQAGRQARGRLGTPGSEDRVLGARRVGLPVPSHACRAGAGVGVGWAQDGSGGTAPAGSPQAPAHAPPRCPQTSVWAPRQHTAPDGPRGAGHRIAEGSRWVWGREVTTAPRLLPWETGVCPQTAGRSQPLGHGSDCVWQAAPPAGLSLVSRRVSCSRDPALAAVCSGGRGRTAASITGTRARGPRPCPPPAAPAA